MATITFTDSAGAVTFSNGATGPMSRFSQWTPDISRPADRRVSVGTGRTFEYAFRQDYLATFVVEHIPLSQLENALRFKAWAVAGNSFTVNTQDVTNNSYLCRIAPGADLEISMEDRTLLEYRMTISVMSAATTPEFLACEYRA